jgi:hypothetical protein
MCMSFPWLPQQTHAAGSLAAGQPSCPAPGARQPVLLAAKFAVQDSQESPECTTVPGACIHNGSTSASWVLLSSCVQCAHINEDVPCVTRLQCLDAAWARVRHGMCTVPWAMPSVLQSRR